MKATTETQKVAYGTNDSIDQVIEDTETYSLKLKSLINTLGYVAKTRSPITRGCSGLPWCHSYCVCNTTRERIYLFSRSLFRKSELCLLGIPGGDRRTGGYCIRRCIRGSVHLGQSRSQELSEKSELTVKTEWRDSSLASQDKTSVSSIGPATVLVLNTNSLSLNLRRNLV